MKRRPAARVNRKYRSAACVEYASRRSECSGAVLMVPSLLSLCAGRVVSDHGSSPHWLGCVPRELYRPLLEAALAQGRPLAVGELVLRWPERTLRLGPGGGPGGGAPSRLCVQSLLNAVVKGLRDPRCSLRVLDLCGVQCELGAGGVDAMGGWSFTVALCSAMLQAMGGKRRWGGCPGEREQKRVLARDREVKRERGRLSLGVQTDSGGRTGSEMGGAGGTGAQEGGGNRVAGGQRVVELRADLFVNAGSWARVRAALEGGGGALRLRCRELRVEELASPSIAALLALLPERRALRGLDLRYSSLGATGLAQLLPSLASCPGLRSLRLHYCNLDTRRPQPGQQEALAEVARGLGALTGLRRLGFTALRLPGHLRLLLSALSQPLEVLELPYFSLSPADLSYLSSSAHAPHLRCLDLSENRLDPATLPSLTRLLARASGLAQLSLCGCSLTDGLLGALLPSLSRCGALCSLGLALNPLTRAGVLSLGRAAARMPSLRLLLYPYPLESYQAELPAAPSSAQLLDWPLEDEGAVQGATRAELDRALRESSRTDLLLTSDALAFSVDAPEDEEWS
ncbi:leucine-rich repeat-containing protein 14 [Amia ocellicauda]|uniref:leucine-rich repeat-containing protein 14 n=1 Tax=Amia ocellicauda TaxID=2972642 RepID=UPI0034639DF9